MAVKWMTKEHKGGNTSVLYDDATGKIIASIHRATGDFIWDAEYKQGGMYDGEHEYVDLEHAQIAVENQYHRQTGERIQREAEEIAAQPRARARAPRLDELVAEQQAQIRINPAWANANFAQPARVNINRIIEDEME